MMMCCMHARTSASTVVHVPSASALGASPLSSPEPVCFVHQGFRISCRDQQSADLAWRLGRPIRPIAKTCTLEQTIVYAYSISLHMRQLLAWTVPSAHSDGNRRPRPPVECEDHTTHATPAARIRLVSRRLIDSVLRGQLDNTLRSLLRSWRHASLRSDPESRSRCSKLRAQRVMASLRLSAHTPDHPLSPPSNCTMTPVVTI